MAILPISAFDIMSQHKIGGITFRANIVRIYLILFQIDISLRY